MDVGTGFVVFSVALLLLAIGSTRVDLLLMRWLERWRTRGHPRWRWH